MLKRTVVRLLLFGVPFTMAYYGARPAPVKHVPTFVLCGFSETSDTGSTIVVAETLSACSVGEGAMNETTLQAPRPAVRLSSGDKNGGLHRAPLHFSF